MSDVERQSGWVGWAVFGGIVLIILGVFNALFGLAAVLGDSEGAFFVPVTGTLWLVDPENGRELRVDTDDSRLRARFAEAAAAERAAVAHELASAGVAHVALSTDRDWLRDLAVFVRRRRA